MSCSECWNSNDHRRFVQMKSFNNKKKWCGGSQSMAPLHQPSSTYGGSNLSLPSLVLRSLRSQWQAQVQAIPRAVASARGAIGLVQQLQRPVLEGAPGRLPKKWEGPKYPKSWGYPVPSNSWWLSKPVWKGQAPSHLAIRRNLIPQDVQQILRIGAKLHPMRHGIPLESWAKGDPWPMTLPFRSQLRSTETSE